MDSTTPDKRSLAEVLAKLDEAMRPQRGSSTDPDRRRAAARLSDLALCEDDELSAFARRHLPGQTVDETGLRSAREMILRIAQVVGPGDGSAGALDALVEMPRTLDERLAEAKRASAQRDTDAASSASAPPPPVPLVAPTPLRDPLPALIASPALVAAPALVAPPAIVAPLPPAPVPAPVFGPPPVSAPVFGPPPATTPPPAKRPVWADDPDGGELTLCGPALPVQSALPFLRVTPQESSRRAVTRLDGALPFQPIATPDPSTHGDPAGLAPRDLAPSSSALPVEIPTPSLDAGPTSVPAHPSVVPVPPLTLHQYVWLVVTCNQYPHSAESVLVSYGVTSPAVHEALDTYWAERIAADPALLDRWNELYASALQYATGSPEHGAR